MKRLRKWDVVRVYWIDSVGDSTYWGGSAKTTIKEMECVTVGMVVQSSKKLLTIASSRHQHEIGGTISIPRFAITRVEPMY